ncbi:transglutaminase family protein [Thalassiella azotivora]
MSRGVRAGWLAALATALVATGMSTLVEGTRWFVELLAVLVAVVLTGNVTARLLRRAELVVAVQLVAVLLVLTWLYALPEAWAGLLPTPASWQRLVDLADVGLALARDEAPPAPAEAGLRLLLTAGLGLVAVAVDAAAAGWRQPAVAGLPLLAVYCVPAALARGGLDWYWFVLGAGGFLALLASDSTTRVARWGRVLRGQGGEQAPLAAAGRRVGAVALAAAVLVPTLVPGLSEGLLPGTGAGGDGPGGRIEVSNPLFDLRENLAAREDVTVLTYTTDQPSPEPVRWVVADSYDGNTWGPTSGAIPREQQASDGLPEPPGLTDRSVAAERTTTVTIDRLTQSAYLPLVYPPTALDVEGSWLYETTTLNVIGDGVSTAQGLQYTVEHLQVAPDPATLAAAPAPPPAVTERWTTLPPSVPETVVATAREVVDGQPTPFAQASALQSWFRSGGGFSYDEEAPDGTGTSAIADFLERRSGFCVHFSATMAVMARSLGIPARVAVGFLPGEEVEEGTYRVSLQDAHAWPELYFGDVGWVRFEPTPATRTGSVPGWTLPPAEEPAGAPAPAPSASAPVPVDPGSLAQDGAQQEADAFDLRAALAEVPWRLVAALAVVLAVLTAPWATSVLVRRARWRRADGSAARVEAAWRTLGERLDDLGAGWPRSATPRQAETAVAEGLDEDGRQALHRLARAVERCRYAPAPPEATRGLRTDVRAVVHAVRDRRPTAATWRARVVPRSGVEHLRGALVDAGLAVDRWERRTAARVASGWSRVARRRDVARS